MISVEEEARAARVRELARSYADEGFDVTVDPRPEDLPFDLFGYRPTLVARRGDEGHLVEVRVSGRRLSVDWFQEIASEVRRHPGWRFILATADDVSGGVPGADGVLPTWDQLRERAAAALATAQTAPSREAAFLAMWATLEGVLRKIAEHASLPVERLPSSTLIKHLHSHGELSMEQFDTLIAALDARNRVVHGYDAPEIDEALRGVGAVLAELLSEVGAGHR